jgi:histidinol-phosphatase (PHP family)
VTQEWHPQPGVDARSPRPEAGPPRGVRREGSRNLPLDSHLHTALSPDSDVPIDVYAAQAVERGIREIAITDHVDFDPRGAAYAYASFETREREAREAAERWADKGVDIRFGTEITYDRDFEADIRQHLAEHTYDFVIGSVHVGVDSPYREERVASFVAGKTMAEIVAPYFHEVVDAARSGLFDTIGHIDFIKRYVHPHRTAADFAGIPELYEPILKALVETETALEVNTSGLRQSPAETYPAEPIVERFRALGGRHVTAGSDAHRADAFAFGLEDGYRVAAGAGFRELLFRRGGSRLAVQLPDRLGT